MLEVRMHCYLVGSYQSAILDPLCFLVLGISIIQILFQSLASQGKSILQCSWEYLQETPSGHFPVPVSSTPDSEISRIVPLPTVSKCTEPSSIFLNEVFAGVSAKICHGLYQNKLYFVKWIFHNALTFYYQWYFQCHGLLMLKCHSE